MTSYIIFSMIETKDNITYATLVVSCFAKNPSHLHSKAVKTVFHYLKATRDVGIIYKREHGENPIIRGYSDSDWASDHVTRKLISKFIFMLNGNYISWCSKRQTTTALSLTEIEYGALISASKEATWLRLLLTKLGLLHPVKQYADIKIVKRCTRVSEIKSNL